ncbi:MAG TPA: hypothetical protein VGI03_08115 [Verrucomicrobiae bacterium]|jgi:sugar lactone lactonase YvrE
MKSLFLWRSLSSALAAALIFNAGNVFAGATVNWISGGPNPDELGVSPTGAGYSDGDITSEAEYNTPRGLCVDPTGDFVFLADQSNNVVRTLEFDDNTAFTQGGYIGGNLMTNIYNVPVGVAVDSTGNIFVVNHGNGKNGSVIILANGFIDNNGDSIFTNATGLTNANGIALDSQDNIYVTVNSNQVLELTALGASNIIATVNQPGACLQGLVVRHSGMLAVCDSARDGVYQINPNTGLVTTNAGFHGQGDFQSANNVAPSNVVTFFQPMGVAETGEGDLLVSDYGNSRVKVVLPGGTVTNLYGVSSNLWGGSYPGFQDGTVQVPDSKSPNVQARNPSGVAFAPDGTVYVTEDYYNIIRHISNTGFSQPPAPAPAAPTGLTATAGYGQVTLSWSPSFGATSNAVERSTTSGSGYATIGYSTGTSFVDTNGLTDGTNYYYVVSAVNNTGSSPFSAQVSAIPLFSPAPTITSVATNYNQVTLTWSQSQGATSYNVERSQTSGTFNQPPLATTTTTTYTDTTAVNGTTYYYVIQAVNSGGVNPTNSAQVAATPPLPPVPDPVIGWVTYPLNTGQNAFLSVLNPGSPAGNTFNNDVDLVISNPPGTEIFFNVGNTTVVTNVLDPTPSSTTAPAGYVNGLPQSTVEASYTINGLVQPAPNLMIKAIGEQSGHPSSDIVAALFQFVVGQPQAIGTNAGQFTLTNITVGSTMYYTYAYNTSLPGYPSATNPAAIGPITNGATLALNFPQGTTNLTFEAVGYRANYTPSAVYTNNFASSNFLANTISFGFASGPGSSQFVASPGQSFVLPIGLSMLASSPSIYGLQFNITLTNLTGPAVDPGSIGFTPLIGKPDPKNPGYFAPIPPYMFVSTNQIPPNNDPDTFLYQSNWYQGLQFIDTNNEILLGLGWLEIYGRTNLYDTVNQNLLSFPIFNGNDPYPSSQSIVGGYSFGIPANAIPGDVYQLQIGRPSATAFPGGLSVNPYGVAVGIVAATDTNLVGPGSVNALKNVTIGQIKYLVGDVHPANWFNAGDFGSSNLDNLDVSRVFDFAVYPIAAPPYGSDLFDALDSCGNSGVLDGATGYYTNANNYAYYTNFSYSITNTTIYENTNGVVVSSNSTPAGPFASPTLPVFLTTYFLTVNEEFTNTYIITNSDLTIATNLDPVNNFVNIPVQPGDSTLFSGNDTTINQIAFGDGVLDVCDVYVTFRRSLDTNNLVWFERFWTNGVRVAISTNASAVIAGAVSKQSGGGKIQPGISSASITNAPLVNFTAGDFQATAGQTIQIPVTAAVFGNYALRVMMLNMTVVPLDGSPALTTPISFSPNVVLGAPYTATSSGNNNYAAAWLNSAIAGLSNNATIGTLTITVPANATSMSAYAIHFDHASGSPNGLASFPKHTLTGLITLTSRTTSSYGDGIPDSWRLRYFGTTNNWLSVSNADADGTGMNNWQKYVAGLNPVDPSSILSRYFAGTDQAMAHSQQDAVISWPSVYGVDYVIQRSSTLFPSAWTSISTNIGTGNYMEIHDSPPGPNRFYRVEVP